jgi:transposase
MDTGAIVAVTVQGTDEGDTQSIKGTLEDAEENLEEAAREPEARRNLADNPLAELVADKGYHSNERLKNLAQEAVRSYVSEPERGRRQWRGDPQAQEAVYANRRRIRGERGKRLLRRRGELVERSFAHLYKTGGMRRTHLRGHENILKRLLIHAGAFNLSLVFRQRLGAGTPKGLNDLCLALFRGFSGSLRMLVVALCRYLGAVNVFRLRRTYYSHGYLIAQ